jgi:hypothetical protein
MLAAISMLFHTLSFTIYLSIYLSIYLLSQSHRQAAFDAATQITLTFPGVSK